MYMFQNLGSSSRLYQGCPCPSAPPAKCLGSYHLPSCFPSPFVPSLPSHWAILQHTVGFQITVPLTVDDNFHWSLKKSNNPIGWLPVMQFPHISTLGFSSTPFQACSCESRQCTAPWVELALWTLHVFVNCEGLSRCQPCYSCMCCVVLPCITNEFNFESVFARWISKMQ